MLAKKDIRGMGYIAVGCASTGLVATISDYFYTAHDLFTSDEIEPPTETKRGII